MSKSNSNLFPGTQGHKSFFGKNTSEFIDSRKTAEELIIERAEGLDTREHIVKNKKILSRAEMRKIESKIAKRTATIKEYKDYEMTRRLKKRRDAGVRRFWAQEKQRIREKLPTTRKWTPEQKAAILSGKRPRFNGKTIQGHHTYSVSKYPHLANLGELIYPVTHDEHLKGWHGGNYQNSLPGKPIKHLIQF